MDQHVKIRIVFPCFPNQWGTDRTWFLRKNENFCIFHIFGSRGRLRRKTPYSFGMTFSHHFPISSYILVYISQHFLIIAPLFPDPQTVAGEVRVAAVAAGDAEVRAHTSVLRWGKWWENAGDFPGFWPPESRGSGINPNGEFFSHGEESHSKLWTNAHGSTQDPSARLELHVRWIFNSLIHRVWE
jgi:hypothetical protein